MLYRQNINFLEDVSPDGTIDPEYQPYALGIPAAIVPKSGGEVYRGVQLQAQTNNVIEMRWIDGLLPNMTIQNVATNQTYLITRMIDVNGRQREWLIEATEVVV